MGLTVTWPRGMMFADSRTARGSFSGGYAMRGVAAFLALLIAAATATAAPAPVFKNKKPMTPPGPFEIDFTPLEAMPRAKFDLQMTIQITGKGDNGVARLTLAFEGEWDART